MNDLYVVMPHYGPQEVLDRCLASLAKMRWHDREGIDGHLYIIDQNPPNRNRYFTWAINRGLRRVLRARDRSRECMIWLLNDDTEVEPDTALQAEACFEEEGWGKCGLVGTRCVKLGEPDRIVWGGSGPCYPNGVHKCGSVAAGQLNLRTEEEWITFASVFVNARTVEDIGLLDQTMEHICSDSDYCFRARAGGWKCFHEPKAVVHHAVGTSNHTRDPVLIGVMRADRERFKAKWITGALFRQLTVHEVRAVPAGA